MAWRVVMDMVLVSPAGTSGGFVRRSVWFGSPLGSVAPWPDAVCHSVLSRKSGKYPWRLPHFVVLTEAAIFAICSFRLLTEVVVGWPMILSIAMVPIWARMASWTDTPVAAVVLEMVVAIVCSEHLLITAEHSNNIDVGNQMINRLWQECCALAFLLIYDVYALPMVFLYVGIFGSYWYYH